MANTTNDALRKRIEQIADDFHPSTEAEAVLSLQEMRDALLEALAAQPQAAQTLTDTDVEWVVNDNAELGVKIGNQFFFLYKGRSLVYKDSTHDDGTPMQWRPVFKREFGECCHPINYKDLTRIGTVSLNDSEEWKPLPLPPKEST